MQTGRSGVAGSSSACGSALIVWSGPPAASRRPRRAVAAARRLADVTDTSPDPGLIPSLRALDRDARLLFPMRTLRMFGYGFLAVVLVLYLAAVGLDRADDRRSC